MKTSIDLVQELQRKIFDLEKINSLHLFNIKKEEEEIDALQDKLKRRGVQIADLKHKIKELKRDRDCFQVLYEELARDKTL
jgi:peptidoglycan hydrolase CwlO-like protein